MMDRAPIPPLPSALRAARDDVLERFEEAWEDGKRPAVEEFLPPSDPEKADLRRAVLPRLAAIDLERRLTAREDVGAADYLRRFPELERDDEAIVSLLVTELECREVLTPAEREALLARFPAHRAEVEGRLADTPTRVDPIPPPPTEMPRRFGRYHVLELLGRGGMGTVHRAYDPILQRYVALKTPIARTGPAAEHFLREAKAAAALPPHPNLCLVYEAGDVDGVPYLTMVHVKGARPLTTAFPPPLPPRRAADLALRIALAMAEAHRHGVLHRDLKPGNILVGDRGEPVVADFGLARHGPTERLAGPFGTYAYMSPEQARGDTAAHGPATDVYSLGVILFELLTGRLPSPGEAPSEARPGLDPALERICRKATSARIEDRHPGMTALADALAEWLNGPALPMPAEGTAAPPAPDPRAFGVARELLRQWGWERGLARLREAEETDEAGREALRVARIWLAFDRGHYDVARAALTEAAGGPLAGWALAAWAAAEMRERRYDAAEELLNRAAAAAPPDDAAVRATVAHIRGALAHHLGRPAEALKQLHAALETFGPRHFGAGRVLDTLGMVHANLNNFPDACEFYAEALRLKEEFHDDAGVALTHGQLGRLHLDWGTLGLAEEHFRKGADRARETGDARGEAQLCNHIGQVLLGRGRAEDALACLDDAVRLSREWYPIVEAFARKDRASVRLALGDVAGAAEDAEEAERMFGERKFDEGRCHARRVLGLVRQAQGRGGEAVRLLEGSARCFEDMQEWAEAARCWRELGRARRAAGDASAWDAFTASAACARRGRRDRLAAAVERERGPAPQPDPADAADPDESVSGVEEAATVLAVELRRDDEAEAPADVRQARAHLLLHLRPALADADVVADHDTDVGCVALAAGPGHARRAARAAEEVVKAVRQHNRPRKVLGAPLWQVRAALDTGLVFHGGGAASGAPVVRAAWLLAEAEPERPRLTGAVFDELGGGVAADGPRASRAAARVWDLLV